MERTGAPLPTTGNGVPGVIHRSPAFLSRWGWGKMATIFQTTYSNGFSWMKMYEFWLKFHRTLFLRVQLAIFHHGWDNGLAPIRWQAIIWIDDCLVCWCIYISLDLKELIDSIHNHRTKYRLEDEIKCIFALMPLLWLPRSNDKAYQALHTCILINFST